MQVPQVRPSFGLTWAQRRGRLSELKRCPLRPSVGRLGFSLCIRARLQSGRTYASKFPSPSGAARLSRWKPMPSGVEIAFHQTPRAPFQGRQHNPAFPPLKRWAFLCCARGAINLPRLSFHFGNSYDLRNLDAVLSSCGSGQQPISYLRGQQRVSRRQSIPLSYLKSDISV